MGGGGWEPLPALSVSWRLLLPRMEPSCLLSPHVLVSLLSELIRVPVHYSYGILSWDTKVCLLNEETRVWWKSLVVSSTYENTFLLKKIVVALYYKKETCFLGSQVTHDQILFLWEWEWSHHLYFLEKKLYHLKIILRNTIWCWIVTVCILCLKDALQHWTEDRTTGVK